MLQVHGRDTEHDSYRVSLAFGERQILGLVPESLIGAPTGLGAPRHQHAYEWLADNRARIEAALRAKSEGRSVRAPFDRVELAEEK
ncbi:MAG: hypothetical protein AAGB05_17690 [Pseudomonadota bacterium]